MKCFSAPGDPVREYHVREDARPQLAKWALDALKLYCVTVKEVGPVSHQCRNVLRVLAVLVALGASAVADSALYSADAAEGRSGGGGRGGMRAGGIASGGHPGGPRGHGISIGAAGGWHGSRGHRSHSFRTPFTRSHKFRHRSTAFVSVTGLLYPYDYQPYGYYPYYSPYPAYSLPYVPSDSGSAYSVEYPQSAGTYAYAGTDGVRRLR
jgi:hypothetical protein